MRLGLVSGLTTPGVSSVLAQPSRVEPYRQVMTPTDRDHLVGNIVLHLSQGAERFIQERAVNDYWAKVDPDLAACVARDVGLAVPV
jgi:catalase